MHYSKNVRRKRSRGRNVDQDSRKDLMNKMFDAALKERFSQLGRKYDWDLVLEIWAHIIRNGGVKACLGKEEWASNMTLEQALDLLDEYCQAIESLIQERLDSP
jgi:hypothetical protein